MGTKNTEILTSSPRADMTILGLMSGTSLDGLDLAICRFYEEHKSVRYEIVRSKTIAYSNDWKEKLSGAMEGSGRDFQLLNAAYGTFLGEQAKQFIEETGQKVDLIASHGHTVFHQPLQNYTTQIGSGAHIAAVSGCDTVCDFRSTDVALGGNGAPLVPIGDEFLFSEFDGCLNIGGIANISFNHSGKRLAYDICIANMGLNYLTQKISLSYDDEGRVARSGKIDETLLKKLSAFSYFSQEGAKSIGREWFETEFRPLLDSHLQVNDLLATFTEHIAEKIGRDIKVRRLKRVLVTGGGALNKFLIERLIFYSGAEIVIPSKQIIEFKEALIFAFLGYLRAKDRINVLSSVTGSRSDSVSGAIYRGTI